MSEDGNTERRDGTDLILKNMTMKHAGKSAMGLPCDLVTKDDDL